jgi:hypothetical protein
VEKKSIKINKKINKKIKKLFSTQPEVTVKWSMLPEVQK